MSDGNGEKTTDQTKSSPIPININVEDIIKQAVQGISKELPNIIDAHLKERDEDLLSTIASDDIDNDQEDAGAFIKFETRRRKCSN